MTLEIPYEEFDRLNAKDGLAGVGRPPSPTSRMIFLNDVEPMTRQERAPGGASCRSTSSSSIDRLLRGYGVPIDTLETPEYDAYDASIKVELQSGEGGRAAEGVAAISPDNPVKFTIQTTRGFKPKDYEMIQAIVGMWRKVGIEAEIEVYEIAKHYELRAADTAGAGRLLQLGQLDRRSDDLDRLCHVRPVPHSVWDGQDVIDMISPLWGETGRGQAHRRLEGGRQATSPRKAYVIPLLQYVQPIVYRRHGRSRRRTCPARAADLMTPAG